MLVDKIFKRASLSSPPDWLYRVFGSATSSGETVTTERAIGLPALGACVRILSEAIGQLPAHVYDETDSGPVRVKGHRLEGILNLRANQDMSGVTFKEVMMRHLALNGNAYAAIMYNGRGEVSELIPLLPEATVPRRRTDGRMEYQTTVNGKTFQLEQERVLHFKGPSHDGLVGLSPIAQYAELIGASIARQKSAGKFWANGAQVLGVLKHPGRVADKEKALEEWKRLYSGTETAFKTALLDQGMEYERIGIPPGEAQFVEQTKLSDSQIATIFGVPPHRINQLDRMTWNNIDAMGLDFVIYTLGPWLARIEKELDYKLIAPQFRGRRFVKIDPRGLMRGDHKARSDFYARAVQWGWMTRNEVRQKEDLPALEGLDDPLTPVNMTTEPDGAQDDGQSDQQDDTQSDDERARRIVQAAIERVQRATEKTCRKRIDDYEKAKRCAEYAQKALALSDEEAARYGKRVWQALQDDIDVKLVPVMEGHMP